MRLRTLGVAAALTAAMFQTSTAFVQSKTGESGRVTASIGSRAHRAVAWRTGAALAQRGLSSWTAIYDVDTDVPLRLWGPSELTAGSVATPAIAEAAARAFLAQHITTLAPGSQLSDFTVLANALTGGSDVRTVIFQQHAGGIPVHEAVVSISFKRDRLVLAGSTAMPNVRVATSAARVPAPALGVRTISWLAQAGFDVQVETASALVAAPRVIIPTVRPRGTAGPNIVYQLADTVAVREKAGPGRWQVWLDAATGAPIARSSKVQYATGKVLFNVPQRHPASTRVALPAAFATHTIDGVNVTALADGSVTWTGNAAGSVALKTTGTFTRTTSAVTFTGETQSLAPNGTVTWNRSTSETDDAVLSGFVHAGIVRAWAQEHLDPNLPWLAERLDVNVNQNDTCNAFYDGNSINFFRRSQQCENTGRLADVVYHEFGHGLHDHANPMGITDASRSLSEGVSDFLSALITHDNGLGRGFFLNNEPLRNLDPVGSEKHWPEDAGEVHAEGEIIGGTLWDMKTNLVAALGETAGWAQAGKVYYGVIARSADMISTYPEALVADDDDGNLANGTPNECAIQEAFERHGLFISGVSLSATTAVREKFTVSATPPAQQGANGCSTATIASAALEWKLRGGTVATIPMTDTAGTFAATMPSQPDGSVVQYKVVLTLDDGTAIKLPNNVADPFYEFYVGTTTPVYCQGFEAGLDGWTTGAVPSNRNEWEVGAPQGLGGDPSEAFAGTGVLGLDLNRNGIYPASVVTWAESPEIDLQGQTAVRLHLERWLGVEDAFFDKARIKVNGTQVWSSYASPSEATAGTHHVDREWRFMDIDLAAHAATGKVKLRFELESDPGLFLSGWNLDDVCVVALSGPAVTCGNGAVDADETCDDGNRIGGDGCDVNCATEGSSGDGDGDADGGGDDDGGGCATSSGASGATAFALLGLGLLLGRKRRHS